MDSHRDLSAMPVKSLDSIVPPRIFSSLTTLRNIFISCVCAWRVEGYPVPGDTFSGGRSFGTGHTIQAVILRRLTRRSKVSIYPTYAISCDRALSDGGE